MTDEDDLGGPDLNLAAYHEAGHVVAFVMTGLDFNEVTILGSPDHGLPHVALPSLPFDASEDAVKQMIRCTLGGAAAEICILGQELTVGAASDHQACIRLLSRITDPSTAEWSTMLDVLWREMQAAFERVDVQAAVRCIAELLLEVGRLSADDAREALRRTELQTVLPLPDFSP